LINSDVTFDIIVPIYCRNRLHISILCLFKGIVGLTKVVMHTKAL